MMQFPVTLFWLRYDPLIVPSALLEKYSSFLTDAESQRRTYPICFLCSVFEILTMSLDVMHKHTFLVIIYY